MSTTEPTQPQPLAPNPHNFLKDEPVPFLDRVQYAINNTAKIISDSAVSLISLPIIILKILFKTSVKVFDEKAYTDAIISYRAAMGIKPGDGEGNSLTVNVKHDDEEPWMKEHREAMEDEESKDK